MDHNASPPCPDRPFHWNLTWYPPDSVVPYYGGSGRCTTAENARTAGDQALHQLRPGTTGFVVIRYVTSEGSIDLMRGEREKDGSIEWYDMSTV